ncbi:major facilitator superfamily domain-containing protein 3 [Sphaerodactylus townsendi]|uniref:major facilitator superfamily domain-containing protein 3 n=1 Tax=Sphaerodactylus townsendi TaxID=933632 RepID=UPI0020266D99|nr:major facilitator superfamily domain-containing protein 3 [Sphaerodactylus townsendi]XP_048338575.1 major facilitator superfamily domain-containing protein 3 [Sphaerodactylus townsendi]
MNPKYALLGVLYFVQGIPYGLQSGLLPIYFRTVGLSLTKISLTKMLYVPWILKVLWAPLVDQYFTKKAWLVLSLGGLALACLACSTMTPETQFLPVAATLLFMNFCASLQDVAVDGVAVWLLRQDEVGYSNTIQVVAYKLGSVVAGGGLLTVLHRLGWGLLFWSLAAVYLLAILYTWRVDLRLQGRLQESQAKSRSFHPWQILRGLLRVPGTLWTAGFVLIYKLGDQGATSMFPLFLLDRDFSPQKLGFWNGIVAMVFSISGSSLGGYLTSKQRHPLALLKVLLVLRICGLLFQTLLTAVYKDKATIFEVAAVLSICSHHFVSGMVTTLTFSIMMHCTQTADESIQATHYSFLATLEVLGKLLFSTLVGSLVDWLGFVPSFCVFLCLSSTSVLYALQAPPAGG